MVARKKRRQAKLKERLTPCNCCGYPISQRHHLIAISDYGRENRYTIQLCANCHELYHIVLECTQGPGDWTRNKHYWMYLIEIWGAEDRRLAFLEKLASAATEKKKEIDAAVTSAVMALVGDIFGDIDHDRNNDHSQPV